KRHQLCESSSYDPATVLDAFERQFGRWLPQVKWVNMGGGHLMTRSDYDVDHLIGLLQKFRKRYPWLEVIMEPGSAFTWRTGDLITSVVDVVENQGVKTAIVDVSFACHMPDTLEMPYKPAITESVDPDDFTYIYRLGGNSCLSGDYMGDWAFTTPLQIGDRLTLEDMNHYTTVKTTMFNGIQHPAMVLCRSNGECVILRKFDYQDYKSRMD
ncbi:MAG: carboxynorspermidine decarboxylase, partial [Muribaculaceae bacterium]|nr:carboxynorspermidine decarboxylase [Muribaculaceae bacterium]